MNRNIEIAVLVTVLTLSACSGGGSPSGGVADYVSSPVSSRSTSTSSGAGVRASGSYSIGGTVTGLSGSGLTLQLNRGAGLAVAADGTFTFPAALANGTAYTATISAQPSVSREICGVSNDTGTVSTANITNVTVNCSAVIGFLYQLSSNVGNANQIYSYGISAGSGLPIAFGPPVESPPSPTAITVAPGGKYLYVTNSNASNNTTDLPGSVSTFAVNSDTGALTPVGSPIAAGTGEGAGETAVSSSGHLFVYNWNVGDIATNTPPGPQTLIEYALDPASGAPTLIGAVLTFPATAETSFQVTPDGRFLYVLTGSPELNTPISNTLTVYAIAPVTGALTPGSSISPGNDVGAMTIDPLGRFLYLTNSTGTYYQQSGTVQPYAIDSGSGTLTAIGTGTAVVSNGAGLAADPTGHYLYLISNLNFNAANNTIQALDADPSTGSVRTTGSIVQTPGAPSEVLCDPSGQFVYLESGAPGAIDQGAGVMLTTFSVSTSPATAGQLISSGPSLRATGQGGGAIAIVE